MRKRQRSDGITERARDWEKAGSQSQEYRSQQREMFNKEKDS